MKFDFCKFGMILFVGFNSLVCLFCLAMIVIKVNAGQCWY